MPARKGHKGSEMWLRKLVNSCPDLLNGEIARVSQSCIAADNICWLSPLQGENYREYFGSSFVSLLDINLDKYPLAAFWPSRGAQWDALGKTTDGQVLLLEAKSYIGEESGRNRRSKAKGDGRNKIECACGKVKKFLQAKTCSDWLGDHYQFANRLAHLYLLRKLNDIPAFLVMLYFLNDRQMGAPSSVTGWQIAIEREERALGIPKTHQLSKYVIPVFLDVGEIRNKAG